MVTKPPRVKSITMTKSAGFYTYLKKESPYTLIIHNYKCQLIPFVKMNGKTFYCADTKLKE